MTTGEEVAIKLEALRGKHPQLLRETKIYRSLHGSGQRLFQRDIFLPFLQLEFPLCGGLEWKGITM